MSEFATCPKCGRTLRGATTPIGPHESRGQCGKHGTVTVRWLGGKNGARGAPAVYHVGLPPRS